MRPGERPDPFLDRVGHVVEVFLHHIFFHVVDERAVASRGAVDHPGEIVHLDQRIEIVVACWNVDADQVVIFLPERSLTRSSEVSGSGTSESDSNLNVRLSAGVVASGSARLKML